MPLTPRTCPVCKATFTPAREWQVYDSKKCRWIAFADKHPRISKAELDKLKANQKAPKKKKDDTNTSEGQQPPSENNTPT